MDCGAVKQLGDDIINLVTHFRDNLIVENGEARYDDTYTGEDTSNSSTFDGTSNSSTFEEYVKKYCPEYSDETQLMVLCDYPEFKEPIDDRDR